MLLPGFPGFFFAHKKAPPERGWYAHYYHQSHGAGCLPVNSAMTRQNPQLAYTIRNQTSVIMPLRTGGFTIQDPFNKIPDSQTTINSLNCEGFNN